MVCFTMRIVQRILTLLIIVYACVESGYAQTNNDCGLEKFRCRNGECINGDLLCDGKANCKDSSDETQAECKKPEILCPSYAFRCNYGACINGDRVCNGIQDCVDNSDETQPQCTRNTTDNQTERPVQKQCTVDQFQCENGIQCINNIDVCDGTRNCADGSDELSSLCGSLPCPSTAFRCAYGACIDGDLRCNGVADCADSSDEDVKLCRIGWPSPLQPTTGTIQPPLPRPPPTRTTTPRPSVTPSTNTCRAPPQPQNGRWKLHRSQCPDRQECDVSEGTELILGSHLVYSCNSGYKIRGSTDVSCSFEGKWLNVPVCTEIRCKALVTASVRAECKHDELWISCRSPVPPRTKATLTCENSYQPETILLSGQRKEVWCNANGEWEPEPMRCIPVCGTLPPSDITPTVVGGYQPNITEFPWHATMYYGESKEFFCGASIIQEDLLISAAHCVYEEDTKQLKDARKIFILTGNLFRDYNNPFHNSNFVKKNQVKRIYIVRNYLGYAGNYLWDIAILELVRPFVLSALLVPACIDTSNDRNVLEPNTYGKVAGFGRTAFGETSAILQAITVPIVPLSQCKSASSSVNEKFITNEKLCAGYTNGSSVCDGDSGGGLVFKTNDLWYLRGIVSVSLGTIQQGGNSYCDNNLYSLYTEISRHIAWIQDVITKIEQNKTHILCSEYSSTRCS